ncbi:MAG: hypothetical protein DRJ03_01120 [Chloroflexi bacterium]|nr:MAG: hypothetical protein DRJ03_01120 [Chloroflexota bacterium]
MAYSKFNIIKFLDDRNIPWWDEGNNISQGWIGTPCVFCTDHSNHMGINLDRLNYSCWLCHASGRAIDFIMAIEGCDERDARRVMAQYREDGFSGGTEPAPPSGAGAAQTRPRSGSILPSSIVDKWPTPHLSFLFNRGYRPVRKYINKYGLLPVHTIGRYRFRIIIPVYLNNKIVNFTARDVTGKAKERYYHCSNNNALIPRRELLYNLDNATGDNIVLVEGPTDTWLIGDGAVATFGTQVADEQIDLIRERNFKKVYILFDNEPEAQQAAQRVAARIAYVVKEVEVLKLNDEADPGSISQQTVQQIKNLLKE